MGRTPTLTIGQHSEAGRKDRNEDSFGILIPDEPLLTTKGIVMAIADGMSGSEAGKEASESCVKSLLSDYLCTHESWSVQTSVERVMVAVNRWLCSQGMALSPGGMGMVSTLSALILKSGTVAYIFHIGDSRIYRLRGGEIESLTRDHRMQVSDNKTYLSRAMGVDTDLKIDYRKIEVEAGDVFIFTTDGIHDFLPDHEIVAAIASASTLNEAAARPAASALEHGSTDNVTCQIVRVDDTGIEDNEAYFQKLQALPFPPDLEPGMVLDGYRILRELHASKRSQVYLAVDTETDLRVVMKTPSVNFEDDEAYLERFAREEWIGRRLASPHVLKVIEPKRRKQCLYYISEYVEGPTLRQWMSDHPTPSLMEVRDLVAQIAMGLRAFHRREMIHQDLKPENILIDNYGTVKIIDFGSVKVTGLEEVTSPVDAGGVLGTLAYTAPESWLDQPSTNRTDIFSLGVIAYEMLTGARPYGGGFSSRRSAQRRSFVPATDHNPDLPAWVAAALAKAVARDPEKRYDVLSAFTTDLSRPNTAFLTHKKRSWIEKNPAGFWKSTALLLLAVVVVLLYRLLG